MDHPAKLSLFAQIDIVDIHANRVGGVAFLPRRRREGNKTDLVECVTGYAARTT